MISAEEAISRLKEGNKLYVGAIYRIEDVEFDFERTS